MQKAIIATVLGSATTERVVIQQNDRVMRTKSCWTQLIWKSTKHAQTCLVSSPATNPELYDNH